MLASDAMDEGVGRLERATQDASDVAAESAVGVVDHAAWRALQLLIAAFGLGLAYRFVSSRWLAPRGSGDPS